ncbi:MAG: hypothetical protein ACR2L0_00685 [Gaiellaceae bacterium]
MDVRRLRVGRSWVLEVSVAVPDSPEPFCSSSVTVTVLALSSEPAESVAVAPALVELLSSLPPQPAPASVIAASVAAAVNIDLLGMEPPVSLAQN